MLVGKNTFKLNKQTVMQAVEHYLNTIGFRPETAIKVTDFEEACGVSMSQSGELFDVSVEPAGDFREVDGR